jgi:NTP pyrophosphatase (non-canonical NTP hydrolase)
MTQGCPGDVRCGLEVLDRSRSRLEETPSLALPRITGGGDILGYHPGMDFSKLTIAQFQKHISEKYEKVDRNRGTAKTFLWLIEEVGELATALNGDDHANLEEEFADVIAWLCTLANINDVDLSAAIGRKYLGKKRPKGHK